MTDDNDYDRQILGKLVIVIVNSHSFLVFLIHYKPIIYPTTNDNKRLQSTTNV